MNNILEINNLSKSFKDLKVIENLNLTIQPNTVYGLIGKNGSGKTTTMKMILGFLKSDEGNIQINGETVVFGSSTTNKYIGYLPDVPSFYNYMTPEQYLTFCGELAGLKDEALTTRISEVLDLVNLHENRKIKGFSRGMKQRLGIAAALLKKPLLLICDEPTSALDPIGRKEVLDILMSIKSQTTIIFSTHILTDVERVCDHVGILSNGHLVIEGPINEIKERFPHNGVSIELSTSEECDAFEKALAEIDFVQKCKRNDNTLRITFSDMKQVSNEIFKLIVDLNVKVVKYEIETMNLEEVFMEVI